MLEKYFRISSEIKMHFFTGILKDFDQGFKIRLFQHTYQ